jgi:DGQHR domain-containing protein
MPSDRIAFHCSEVSQPIGTFYVGTMDAEDLVAISYADIRRLEERDVEKYLGIQRTLNPARVQDLVKYVNTVDATFPTAVILAVASDKVVFDHEKGIMSVVRDESVAKIIDGQHRIAGLKYYRGGTFMVNVAMFVDMDIEDQAIVFATINLSQTKVSKSLAYDLYEYAKQRSPQKTSHNVVRLLNRENGSPFKDKVKILGRATPGKDAETLTQATIVEALLPYITTNRIEDRDRIKRGEKLERPSAADDTRILRNLFIDEKDEDIALIVWNYFAAVQRRWPYAWGEKEQGNILNRTTGFLALMKFLAIAYRSYGQMGAVVPSEFFETLFAEVKLTDGEFTPERFPPGGSGTSTLYRQLVEDTAGHRDRARPENRVENV